MKKAFLPLLAFASCISISAQTKTVISGDYDGDGQITVGDVEYMAGIVLGTNQAKVLKLYDDPFNGHEYVDLGLTTKDGKPIYWATCNVGAEDPIDKGLYFAWGETISGHNFEWEYYKWHQPIPYSYGEYITKYTLDDGNTYGIWNDSNGNFIGDGKWELEAEDDAAHENWGGLWRMPTQHEIISLYSDCIFTWNSNKSGYDVTGPNGNSIFFPEGIYTSSELYDTARAYDIIMYTNVQDEHNFGSTSLELDIDQRITPFLVRAVCELP